MKKLALTSPFLHSLRYLLVGGIVALFLISGMAGCNNQSVTKDSEAPKISVSAKTVPEGQYIGSDYKGNYIYAAAMNLAWNELNENVINEKVQLKTEDKDALLTLQKLNNPTFTRNDLDEKSYYIKSGYGQKTIEAINSEVKTKFPEKSFGDLQLKLAVTDIIAYAYFLKQVEYLNPFKEDKVLFIANNDPDFVPDQKYKNATMEPFVYSQVKGFIVEDKKQRENVKILKYWNDDRFIISLQLKDDSDELYIAKGFYDKTPDNLVKQLNQYANESMKTAEVMTSQDVFQMPLLAFDYHREFPEMIGQALANKDFEKYLISQMFENIKFKMDFKGARVENEAAVIATTTAFYEPPSERKQLILDKPFWVIMKRKGSLNPYFILKVENTEFMQKD